MLDSSAEPYQRPSSGDGILRKYTPLLGPEDKAPEWWRQPKTKETGVSENGADGTAQAPVEIFPHLRAVLEPFSANLWSFLTFEKWEGVVTEVREDGFIAVLKILTEPRTAKGETLEVTEADSEFETRQVSLGQRHMIVEGAVFHWHIGVHTSPSGQVIYSDEIIFRDLPPRTDADMEEIKREAEELFGSLKDVFESPPSPE